jgi:hypothetical protein
LPNQSVVHFDFLTHLQNFASTAHLILSCYQLIELEHPQLQLQVASREAVAAQLQQKLAAAEAKLQKVGHCW